MVVSFLAGAVATGCIGVAVAIVQRRRQRSELRLARDAATAAEAALAESAHVHRRSAEGLLQSERVQALILNSLDEGVALHDPEVGVIAANRAANEMLRIAPGPQTMPQQIRRTFDVFEPDGRPIDPEDTPSKRALRSGEPQKGRILRYQHHDGHTAWMRIDAYPIAPSATSPRPRVLMAFADITAHHDAARQLAESEERLRVVIEGTRELITVVDADGIITYTSPSSRDILGLEAADTIGQPVSKYIHSDDYSHALANAVMTDGTASLRARVQHADGNYRSLETLATRLDRGDGPMSGIVLSSRDITQRLEIERQLETERQLLRATINSMHAGVLAVDRTGIIIEVNQAFHDLAGTDFGNGAELNTFTDNYTLIGADGNVIPHCERPLSRALAGATVVDEPITLQQADGRRVQVLASASPISDGVERTGAVLTLHDVTELRAVEAVLRNLATTDTLTGLPNRRTVIDRLGQALSRQRRHNHRVSVLFIDLDGFKAINDNLGHEAGDQLLVAAAERIAAALRPADFVGRHGGDEFVIIAEDIDPADARGLAVRLETELTQPFLLTAGVAHIGGSIGVADAEADSTPDSLLATADAAMYHAKRRHRIQ